MKRNEQLLRDDICSLVKAERITMSRAREILCLKYLEDMRNIYFKYIRRTEHERQ